MSSINDLEERKIIWLAFSDLFLDTDVTLFYDSIVNKCATSKYSINELEMILKDEVAPACSFNLNEATGEWAGFGEDFLQKRIIWVMEERRTTLGKLKSIILIGDFGKEVEYADNHWKVISKRIQEMRNTI